MNKNDFIKNSYNQWQMLGSDRVTLGWSYSLGYFTLWCYGPNLAELKSVTICYNDLVIILVALTISFAIKLIKRITTFQTKSPIAAQSDWRLCHRKIVKSGLKFSQKFI